MEISTVLFDLDGTITDSGSGIINSVKYALKKAGRKIPPEDELRKFIGPPLQEQFMKCCGIEEKEAAEMVRALAERTGSVIAVSGKLDPYYMFGLIAVASPGWVVGTALGVIMGNALPLRAVSALSVGLYGMFIACIIPEGRKNKIVAGGIILGSLRERKRRRKP